jgi:hypothetical protein
MRDWGTWNDVESSRISFGMPRIEDRSYVSVQHINNATQRGNELDCTRPAKQINKQATEIAERETARKSKQGRPGHQPHVNLAKQITLTQPYLRWLGKKKLV